MFHGRILGLGLGLLLFICTLSAQSKLDVLAYSVADTSQSELQQAQSLYDWVVENIAYDTRQLKNGAKAYTPEQTLERKKAVCEGYASLYKALCQSIGLEAHIVRGYAKGFGYVKGDGFIKSDHAWNAVYADSTWILVDATWGSGSITYDYSFVDRLKGTFDKNKLFATQLKFQPQPSSKYFNANPNELANTHFPIDAKWQVRSYPLSYQGFLLDSNLLGPYLNYEGEIAKVRLQSDAFQQFEDAKNSPRYHAQNQYDIATQFYFQANQLQLHSQNVLDSSLLGQIDRALDYFEQAKKHNRGFQQNSRLHYNTKRARRKEAYRPALYAMKAMKRIPTVENGRYEIAYKRLLKSKNELETLHVMNFNKKVQLQRLDETKSIQQAQTNSIDPNNTIEQLARFQNQYLEEKQNLQEKIDELQMDASKDSLLVQTALGKLKTACLHIGAIEQAMAAMDEYGFMLYCRQFSNEYNAYADMLHVRDSLAEIREERNESILSQMLKKESLLLEMRELKWKLAKLQLADSSDLNIYEELMAHYKSQDACLLAMKSFLSNSDNILSEQDRLISAHDEEWLINAQLKLEAFYEFISEKNRQEYLANVAAYEAMMEGAKEGRERLRTARKEVLSREKDLEE